MHIWELIMDHIFPPSTEELLIRKANIEDMKNEYSPSQKSSVYFLSYYKRKLIKSAITTAKFSHNKKSISLLATLLGIWLTEHTKGGVLLIPIPLHYKRERERGYNQVSRVLDKIQLENVRVSIAIIKRNRATPPQTTLTKNKRTKNLTGAFTININNLKHILTPEIKQIIICDDVYTTGSTLAEAYKVLKPHVPKNCKLTCLAWAH